MIFEIALDDSVYYYSHHYPTNFSRDNYIVPSFKLTKSQQRITIRAPKLWNIILNTEEKLIENPAIFKATIKTKLVLLENAIAYSQLLNISRIF